MWYPDVRCPQHFFMRKDQLWADLFLRASILAAISVILTPAKAPVPMNAKADADGVNLIVIGHPGGKSRF
jgi:hypothetical protein